MSKIPDSIWQQLLDTEGTEYTDDTSDRGGATKFGISQKGNPDIDIPNLTEDSARKIYEERYWNKLDSDDRDWDNFQRIVHQGPSAYNKTKGLSQEDRTQKDVDKFLGIIERDPSQKKYLNGWMNRALGSDTFGSGKVDLRDMDEAAIRSQVEAPIEVPEQDNIVSEQELTDYDVAGTREDKEDAIQKQQAIADLMETPEDSGDISEGQVALDDMSVATREELVDQGEQVAETTPMILPEQEEFNELMSDEEDIEFNELMADDKDTEFDELMADDEDTEFTELMGSTPPPLDKVATPDYGIGETAALHGAQGVTFGMSENLTGAAYAIEQMMTGENAHRSFGEAFDVGKETAREMNRESMEQNPVAAIGSDIAGGLATSLLLPGSGMAKGAGAVGLGKMTLQGAAEGGVAGFGYSEDGSEKEGTALGLALGGGGTLVLKGIGTVARKANAWRKGEDIADELGVMARDTPDGKGLQDRVDTKMYDNSPSDTINYQATSDEIDLETLMLTDDVGAFSSELNRIQKTGEGMADSYSTLKKNTKYDQKRYGLNYEAQLKKLQQDADSKLMADMDDTIAGDAPVVDSGELHVVFSPEDIADKNTMAIFRSEQIKFMQFVTNSASRTRAQRIGGGYQKLDMSSEAQIKELIGEFRASQKAGLASEEQFALFRQQRYTLEAAGDIRNEWVAKKTRSLMTTEGYIKKEARAAAQVEFDTTIGEDLGQYQRKFLETNIMFREIDRTTKGMDLEMVQNLTYRNNLQKGNWEIGLFKQVRTATKAIKKSKYSEEDIYTMMSKAEAGEAIPRDAVGVVHTVTEATKSIRDSSIDAGLKIGSKGDFYVPKRRKHGAEYVVALEEFYENRVVGFKGSLSELIKATEKKTDEELTELVKTISPDKREMIGFVQEMRRHVSGDLSVATIDSIFRSKQLRTKSSMKALIEADAGALHSRNDMLPEFILDRKLGRSLLRNVTEASNLIFMEPVGRQLDGRAQILRSIGKHNAADAVSAYRKDVTGQFRETRLGRNESIEGLKLRFGADRVQGILDVWELASNAIYPNLVGGNPASVVRNLTQPLTKTLPEMNFWSPSQTISAYKRALTKLSKGRQELADRGIISLDPEGIISEVDSASKVTDSSLMNVQRKWNKGVMYLFNLSDDINRVVTSELASDISKAVRKGGAEAHKAIEHFPPALQSRALRVMREDAFSINVDKGFEKAVRDHFAVQTQLAYGKVGNSEFVRDSGRLFSMMTKWPVAIGSDMYAVSKQRKPFSRFFAKYFGPAILATGFAKAVQPEEGEEGGAKELLLGTQYGANWTPVSSVVNFNATPPIVSGILGGVKGGADLMGGILADDERQMRHGAKSVKGGMQQFIPVGGSIWKMYDRAQHAFKSELSRSDDLLLPDDFDYEDY